jgi:hypothetical protein
MAPRATLRPTPRQTLAACDELAPRRVVGLPIAACPCGAIHDGRLSVPVKEDLAAESGSCGRIRYSGSILFYTRSEHIGSACADLARRVQRVRSVGFPSVKVSRRGRRAGVKTGSYQAKSVSFPVRPTPLLDLRPHGGRGRQERCRACHQRLAAEHAAPPPCLLRRFASRADSRWAVLGREAAVTHGQPRCPADNQTDSSSIRNRP